jgi:hypothetical protein
MSLMDSKKLSQKNKPSVVAFNFKDLKGFGPTNFKTLSKPVSIDHDSLPNNQEQLRMILLSQ